MYSYRTRVCERRSKSSPASPETAAHSARLQGADVLLHNDSGLRLNNSERDHVLRIDGYARAAADLDQPGELHDRPASGVEDHPLDVACGSLDPIGVSTNDGYLCCRWHVPWAGARYGERLKPRRSGRRLSR